MLLITFTFPFDKHQLPRLNLETLFERNRRRFPAGESLTAYVEDSGDDVEETESAAESERR